MIYDLEQSWLNRWTKSPTGGSRNFGKTQESSGKIYAILNDPILLAAHRAENLGYQKLIRDCLQALIHLNDIANPTRPRVNLERDGYEISSGNIGWIVRTDRF
jgi:hypothetical protein